MKIPHFESIEHSQASNAKHQIRVKNKSISISYQEARKKNKKKIR